MTTENATQIKNIAKKFFTVGKRGGAGWYAKAVPVKSRKNTWEWAGPFGSRAEAAAYGVLCNKNPDGDLRDAQLLTSDELIDLRANWDAKIGDYFALPYDGQVDRATYTDDTITEMAALILQECKSAIELESATPAAQEAATEITEITETQQAFADAMLAPEVLDTVPETVIDTTPESDAEYEAWLDRLEAAQDESNVILETKSEREIDAIIERGDQWMAMTERASAKLRASENLDRVLAMTASDDGMPLAD